MNIVDIINKKRLKQELTDEEIKYVVNGYLSEEIKDYQMSSLLMAILLNDMTNEEIYSLTKYMADSGAKLDLSPLGNNVVDKHSTGGVGDKTTDEFLDYFGLSTKEDLPKIDILNDSMNEEKDLFKSTYKDKIEENSN